MQFKLEPVYTADLWDAGCAEISSCRKCSLVQSVPCVQNPAQALGQPGPGRLLCSPGSASSHCNSLAVP